MIDPVRVDQVLRPLRNASRAQDGRPDLQMLASVIGIRVGNLGLAALKLASQEKLARILSESARLQNFDADAILRFAMREASAPADLKAALSARACTLCGEFKPDVDPVICRCRDCRRSDKVRAWVEEVDQQIDQAPERLRLVWLTNRRSPSYAAMGSTIGMDADQFRKYWLGAGLPPRPIQGRPKKLVDIRSYVPPTPRTFARRRHAKRRPVAPEQGAFDFGGRVAA